MEKITKIVAILVLVVSIAFLLFAAKTIDRIKMQSNLIKSLQENISSMQNTLNSSVEIINTAKTEIGSLRTLVQQLREDIRKAVAAKEKAEKELAEAKKENAKLNTDLKEARGRIAILTEQLGNQPGTVSIPITEGMSLETIVAELTRRLREKENELALTRDRIATLESLGILLEQAPAVSPVEGVPQIVKEIEGKVVDVKSDGVVAINFKGSFKPQKGTTFYIIDSDQVKAKLALKEVYNTIMVANMDIEKHDYNIKSGDSVRLILWTEE
jgi:DNA repair exonuclease SbcCD ATPase subunit